MNKVSGSDKDR